MSGRKRKLTGGRQLSTMSKGKEFERRVGALYEFLGYKVRMDIELDGQQVDIIAERYIAGMGLNRILVECKFRSSGTISNEDVADFSHFYNALKIRHRFTQGVIVASVEFSKNASSLSENMPDIHLLPVSALERQLLDIREISTHVISNYEKSAEFDNYVPQFGSGKMSPRQSITHSIPLDGQLFGWLRASGPGLIAVLADYGGGKTTLLRRLRYLLLRARQEDQQVPCPIFVGLKYLHRYQHLDDFLTQVMIRNYSITLPMDLFWSAVESRLFVFLIDGFDEITTRAEASVRRDSLSRISPLLNSNTRAILTCRPSYFVSTAEYNKLLDEVAAISGAPYLQSAQRSGNQFLLRREVFNEVAEALHGQFVGKVTPRHIPERFSGTIDLATFGPKEIDRYLMNLDGKFRAQFGLGWLAVKGRLEKIYDIRDLMSRPLLLSMISTTFLSGKIDIRSDHLVIGPSLLYELYTTSNLELDYSKGVTRQLLTTDQRREFAELVAVSMLHTGQRVTFDDLIAIVKGYSLRSPGLTNIINAAGAEEAIASDIMYCAFLTRRDEGSFEFAHKSFQEFFAARNVKEAILADRPLGIMATRELPTEVLYFVGGFGMVETTLVGKMIKLLQGAIKEQSGSPLFRNLSCALLTCWDGLASHVIPDTLITNFHLTRARIPQCHFRRIRIADTRLARVDWMSCSLDDLRISQSAFDDGSIVASRAILVCDGFKFTRMEVKDSTIRIDALHDCTIAHSKFTNCEVVVSGQIEINNCSFSNCSLTIESRDVASVGIVGTTFTETTVIFDGHAKPEALRLSRVELDKCAVIGVHLPIPDAPSGTEGPPQITIKQCKGVAFATRTVSLGKPSDVANEAINATLTGRPLTPTQASLLKAYWAPTIVASGDMIWVQGFWFVRSAAYRANVLGQSHPEVRKTWDAMSCIELFDINDRGSRSSTIVS
jgi:hypothetical protein